MSRGFSTAVKTELAAAACAPRSFVSIAFTSGVLYFWTGVGSISWNSQTWTGAGNLLAIEPSGDASGVQALGIKVSLSGNVDSLISAVLASLGQNLPLKWWLGFETVPGTIVSDATIPLFAGRVTRANCERGAAGSRITVEAENRLIDMLRPANTRYTPEEQKDRFAGDKGCDFVPTLQGRTFQWGTQYVSHIVGFYPPDPPPPPYSPPDYGG
jgi:hypothetical protein